MCIRDSRIPWRLLVIAASVLLGLFAASGEASSWDTYLKGFYAAPFAHTDPAFGKNLAFYVFTQMCIRDSPHRLREDNIAWILQQHGYATAAIVTNPAAHPLCLRIASSFSSLPRPPVSSWVFPGTFLLQLRHSLLFNAANGFAVNALLRDFGWLFDRFNKSSWVEPRAVFASAQDLSLIHI